MLDTAVKLSTYTKQRLSDMGKKGMTYDEIINYLISKLGE